MRHRLPGGPGRLGMVMVDHVAPSPNEWSAMICRLRRVLGADAELLAAWLGEPAQLVADWACGRSVPGPAAQRLLRRLGTFADVLEGIVVPERIVSVVHDRLVPLLGGRSYARALAEGMDVDVVIDVARRAAGWPALSQAGRAYLNGPGRGAAIGILYPA